MPVRRKPAARVIGGTLNQAGGFVMRAEKVGRDTMLSQIVKMVANAQLADEHVTAPPDHEFDRRPHGCKIGSNIDRIGDEQQPDRTRTRGLGKTSPIFFAKPQPVTRPICALTS